MNATFRAARVGSRDGNRGAGPAGDNAAMAATPVRGEGAGSTAWASWRLEGEAAARALVVDPGGGYRANKAIASRHLASSHLT
jgi:hypothetical protein